jgi:spore coat polysaccharide biosynthesis protein SpsF
MRKKTLPVSGITSKSLSNLYEKNNNMSEKLAVAARTLLVIQARTNSTRLPAKVLYPIAGLPALVFLIRRLHGIGFNTEVVVATSGKPQDDVCAIWAASEGVSVIRGDEDDVLQRYLQCLERHPAEWVVRVTADNPLTCPQLLLELVRDTAAAGAQYGQYTDIPYGSGVDVFSAGLIRELANRVSLQDEREHINLHILRHRGEFNVCRTTKEGPLARPDVRLTIDTYEDWLCVKSIFDSNESRPWNLSLSEAIRRMDLASVQQSAAHEVCL